MNPYEREAIREAQALARHAARLAYALRRVDGYGTIKTALAKSIDLTRTLNNIYLTRA